MGSWVPTGDPQRAEGGCMVRKNPMGAPAWMGGQTGSSGRSWGVKADPPPATSIQAPSIGRASSTEELGRGRQGNSLPSPSLHARSRTTNTKHSPSLLPGPYPAPHLLLAGGAEASQRAQGTSLNPEAAPLLSTAESPRVGLGKRPPRPSPPSLRPQPWEMPPLGGIRKLPALWSVGTTGRFRGTRERPMGSPSSLIQLPHGVSFCSQIAQRQLGCRRFNIPSKLPALITITRDCYNIHRNVQSLERSVPTKFPPAGKSHCVTTGQSPAFHPAFQSHSVSGSDGGRSRIGRRGCTSCLRAGKNDRTEI